METNSTSTQNNLTTNKKAFLKKHYYIHETMDPESPVIFDGFAKDVTAEFHTTPGHLDYAARLDPTHEFMGGHYITFVFVPRSTRKRPANRTAPPYYRSPRNENKQKEATEVKKPGRPPVQHKSKFEKRLEMIKVHLDVYGNTFTNKNPQKYLDALESQYGYKVSVEYRPKRTVLYRGVGTEIYDEIYILRLVSKPKEEISNGRNQPSLSIRNN